MKKFLKNLTVGTVMALVSIFAFAVVLFCPGAAIIFFWPELGNVAGAPYHLSVLIISAHFALGVICAALLVIFLARLGEVTLRDREERRRK